MNTTYIPQPTFSLGNTKSKQSNTIILYIQLIKQGKHQGVYIVNIIGF